MRGEVRAGMKRFHTYIVESKTGGADGRYLGLGNVSSLPFQTGKYT